MFQDLPEFVQIIAYVTYTIFMFSLVIAFIFFCILAVVQFEMENRLKRDYINSLNEHDKSVVLDYKNIKFDVFKKRKK